MPKKFKKLSIVIPVFNEEKTLEEIIRRVKNVDLGVIEKEIIVVDNNSTDDSLQIARSIPDVIVTSETMPGRGAALLQGFRIATGDIYIFQDADLEYDPNDYMAMIQPILDGKTEMTISYRIDRRKKNLGTFADFLAPIGNFVITKSINWLYRSKAIEYTGCYKAFTARLFNSIQYKSIDFDLDQEIICKVLKRGYKPINVPIRYFPRSYAEGKKINWKHGFMMLYVVFKYRFFE